VAVSTAEAQLRLGAPAALGAEPWVSARGLRVALTATALAGVVGLGLWLRLDQLGLAGISSAEHWKLDAVAHWRSGDLLVDGEHPMLFKAVAFVTTSLFGDTAYALRLPNALIGAVGVPLLIFALGRRLYGSLAGVLAALLAATSTVAVGIDRTGKEDTLMVALALAAVLCWIESDRRPRLGWAALALAGTAVAAKYEALPLVPAMLLASRLGWGPRLRLPSRRPAVAGTAVFWGAFLAANALILLPDQQRFIVEFVRAQIAGVPPPDHSTVQDKTGFHAAGQFHDHKPVWYYLTYLVAKQQLAWIGLALAGLAIAAWRRRPADRFALLWALGVLAVISAVPFGFARYLSPVLPALDLLGGMAAAAMLTTVWRWGRAPRAAGLAAAALAVAALALPAAGARVYPSLYTNTLAGGQDRALYWGADDAGGDWGLDAAARYLADADPGAAVIANDPNLIAYLLDRAGGQGAGVALNGLSADPAAWSATGARYAALQRSMVARSNIDVDRAIRRTRRLVYHFCAHGHALVDVFDLRLPADPTATVVIEPTPAECSIDDKVLSR
jgi:4-amino-4-deoxy-L-arabinose transferase-like glycosyltransferase